jgi:homoserine kinase
VTGFVDGPVTVTVPATSANLGPGYDALGLALELRDRLTAETSPGGLVVDVEGEGCAEVPRDETHLVVRAMTAAFQAMDLRPPGLRLHCRNAVPHARGLGSSSAAIVGGLVLGRALVPGGSLLLADEALLDLACDLEGHPDNVAPAMIGGFVISGREEDRWYAVPGGVDPRVSAVVFVPPTGVETTLARGLLPEQVPHRDAAADAGRAALLVAALAGRPEHLLAATRDFLHQDYRRPAMPDTLALVERLRGDGVPAVVSGAGPTVLAFCDGPDCSAASAEVLTGRCPEGWSVRHLAVSVRGAVIG